MLTLDLILELERLRLSTKQSAKPKADRDERKLEVLMRENAKEIISVLIKEFGK